MDKKSLIILLVSFGLMLGWSQLINKLYPPKPLPAATNTVSSATNSTVRTNLATGSNTPVASISSSAAPSTNNLPVEEQTIVMESADGRYTFTSAGGGLKLVELKNYPESVGCHGKDAAAADRMASLNTKAPLPAFSIRDEDAASPASFRLTKTGDVVRAETAVANGISLVKEFRLSTNYLINVTVRYENHSTQAVRLPQRELVIGTATPMSRHDERMNLGIEWFNGSGVERVDDNWFQNKGFLGFGGQARSVYEGGMSNAVWAAVFNQFFTMIAVPETPGERVIGRRVILPAPSQQDIANDPRAFATPNGYQAGFLLPSSTLNPGHFVEQRYQLFAGPKEYRTLSRLPKDMDHVMGFQGFLGFFAKALLLSMNGIHALGIAYGIAIIIVTVIIKLLFWPLTTASTRSMKRMAALQPQMKALQEKYKDDPKKMNTKLMEFMKEHKVSPLGGCLPLLLQIPVFFGFYRMLQSAIELRGAHFLWACDLSQPDTVFWLGSFPVNPLPVLMAGTMLWQARLTPPSPGIDPVQQKMMRYMPLIFVFFIYNMAAGLTLYWTVQNLLSIAQMKLTRTDDIPGSRPGGTAAKPALPAKRRK